MAGFPDGGPRRWDAAGHCSRLGVFAEIFNHLDFDVAPQKEAPHIPGGL